MKGGGHEQQDSCFFMDPKTHLDPPKTCGQLKKEEQEIYNTQNQDDGYSLDDHNVSFIIDGFVKSRRKPFYVIPAKAGIQYY